MQYNAIQYKSIQYNKIQYNTMHYNTIQYNTMLIFFFVFRVNFNNMGALTTLRIDGITTYQVVGDHAFADTALTTLIILNTNIQSFFPGEKLFLLNISLSSYCCHYVDDHDENENGSVLIPEGISFCRLKRSTKGIIMIINIITIIIFMISYHHNHHYHYHHFYQFHNHRIVI